MATFEIKIDGDLVPGLTWLLAQHSALAVEPLKDERAYIEMVVGSMAIQALGEAREAALRTEGEKALSKMDTAAVVASALTARPNLKT